jgi:uncharacterized protein YbaR (Trm112 family)
VLALLRCPATGQTLREVIEGERHELVTEDGTRRYPVVGGVPMLVPLGTDLSGAFPPAP